MSDITWLVKMNVFQQQIPLIEKYLCIKCISKTITFALIRIRVGEALCLTGLATNQTPKIWPDFVFASVLNRVALGALLDENLLSLFNVTHIFLDLGKTIEE